MIIRAAIMATRPPTNQVRMYIGFLGVRKVTRVLRREDPMLLVATIDSEYIVSGSRDDISECLKRESRLFPIGD